MAFPTCIACGGRLTRGWVAKAIRAPHRWGFWMRSVPGKRGQAKAGDIPLETTKRDDVLAWLGADAEYQAALCVQAVGLLLGTGWPMPALRALVEHLHAQGFMQRVVEHVYEQSPEYDYGDAHVTSRRFAGDLHFVLPQARVTSVTYEED